MKTETITTRSGIEVEVVDTHRREVRRESELARSESNDCVVRAIQHAFEMSYDDAHKFCAKEFNRKFRDGVLGFEIKMSSYPGMKLDEMTGKSTMEVTKEYGRTYYKNKGKMVERKKTIGTFIKENHKGTFLVSISRHAFAIKDGVVYGNYSDGTRARARIVTIWKVVEK